MAELSPYLNTHPIDLALMLRRYGYPYLSRVNDLVRVSIYVDNRLVHWVGDIRPESLTNHSSVYEAYCRRSSSIRGEVTYTRFRRGSPYVSVAPLPLKPRFLRNGKVVIQLNGRQIQSSKSYRKVRFRVQGLSKTPWSTSTRSVRQSTTVRPSPESIKGQVFRTFEHGENGIQLNLTQDVVPYTRMFREWTGTRTPGYGKLRKRALPDNPHSVRKTEVTESRYHRYQTQAASGNWDLRISHYGEFFAMPDSPTLVIPEAEFNALQRLITKSQQGLQANMAQNLAQVSQLSSLIFGTATTIAKALFQLKKGNLISAARTLLAAQPKSKWKGPIGKPSPTKSLASNWLQLQYGWKPLLSDIEGFMTAMGNIQSPITDTVQRVASSATARRYYSSSYPPAELISGASPGVTEFLVTTTCKFRIRFRVDNPLHSFLAQTGFTNPANLVWEILPFSFVADWFLPVGNFLQTMSAWDGCTFLGGSKVSFTRIKGNSTIFNSGPLIIEPTVNVILNATQRREEIRLTRTPISSWPSSVLPSFTSPNFGSSNLNAQGNLTLQNNRAANAVALVIGVFSGRR